MSLEEMIVCKITTVVILLTQYVLASDLVMQSNSPVIHPVLTKTLRLRCSIYKENPNLAALTRASSEREVANLDETDVAYDDGILTNNVTNTSVVVTAPAAATTPSPLSVSSGVDVVHVMTVIINKNISGKNTTIASVTPFNVAAALHPFNETTLVEGGVMTGSDADLQAYLEVTWPNPREEDAGTYSCEVVALAAQGLPMSLTSTLRVTAEEPKFHDVVNYLVSHEKQITKLHQESEDMKRQLHEFQSNSSLVSQSLQVRLNTLDNIQTGTFSCSSPIFIRFEKPYASIPIVFPTLTSLVQTSSNSSSTFQIKLTQVGPTGFTADCGYTGYFLPEFQWLAIGQ
ncbi:unnamed protein product [Lymnaea stagnalis]|uniref:H-type lectin domain-containing protein n=1 Tax=Lymnaea stagnalis TaxID=6523 RepID=A0AAV2IPG4_LYMST